MKIKLLTLIVLITTNYSFSQTETITIPDWGFFSVPATDPQYNGKFDTDITIEIGDTVTWEWQLGGAHNVKSVSGQAVETFGSPDRLGETNSEYTNPYSYSHTFTVLGVNDFICTPHAGFMYGTITVVAEGALSLNNVSKADFSVYPNPSVSELNITMNQADSKTNVTVYNILGKQILSQQLTGFTSKINISQWNVGVYLVKVTNDSGTQTKRFVKQ